MIYQNKIKALDNIFEETIFRISESKAAILDISAFAKKEYLDLEEEFIRLKIEATEVIDRVDALEVDLRRSRDLLAYMSKEYSKYSENDVREIYLATDALRIALAVEKEKELSLIKRRNKLEMHLKSVRKIAEKADKLSQNFDIAAHLLSGDLQQITNQVEDLHNRELIGLKILEAQEIERQRIARDMHDGPAQSLSNLVLKTELCIKLLDKDIERTKLELQTLKVLMRATIDETRRLIYNLRPMSIDDLGLRKTLERFIEQCNTLLGFEILLTYDSDIDAYLNDTITVTIYRIVQEALNNVVKYAKAQNVNVALSLVEDSMVIVIKDDGIGFDPSAIKLNLEDNRGFGLSMIGERASLLLGDSTIESKKNVGTTIKIRIPIHQLKA